MVVFAFLFPSKKCSVCGKGLGFKYSIGEDKVTKITIKKTRHTSAYNIFLQSLKRN